MRLILHPFPRLQVFELHGCLGDLSDTQPPGTITSFRHFGQTGTEWPTNHDGFRLVCRHPDVAKITALRICVDVLFDGPELQAVLVRMSNLQELELGAGEI